MSSQVVVGVKGRMNHHLPLVRMAILISQRDHTWYVVYVGQYKNLVVVVAEQCRNSTHENDLCYTLSNFQLFIWTPAYGRAKAGRSARTYIQQLCEDTGCSPEDLPEAMNDREKWQERVRDICASGTTWWWLHDKFLLWQNIPKRTTRFEASERCSCKD